MQRRKGCAASLENFVSGECQTVKQENFPKERFGGQSVQGKKKKYPGEKGSRNQRVGKGRVGKGGRIKLRKNAEQEKGGVGS